MKMVLAEFRNVSKKYLLTQTRSQSLRDVFANNINRLFNRKNSYLANQQDFFALKDVSFKVELGKSLGIIGANGAGKSTILKLLAGITSPASGEVIVNGKVAALIEIGAGFHGELSGRENIYLYGNIMGMSKKEIEAKFESIVHFSELESFIDMPVKRYSSGMYARLGFSVVAHVEPDLLLIDEVLAVGDMAFQRKCLQRMQEMRDTGCSLIFVSHNLFAVEAVCNEVIWLKNGSIAAKGTTNHVLAEYIGNSESAGKFSFESSDFQNRSGSGEVRITKVELLNGNGKKSDSLTTGSPIKILVEYHAKHRIPEPTFALAFFSEDGIRVFSTNTKVQAQGPEYIEGEGKFICTLDSLPFLPGHYFLRLSISDNRGLVHYDFLPRALNFSIGINKNLCQRVTMDRSCGLVYLPVSWQFVNGSL